MTSRCLDDNKVFLPRPQARTFKDGLLKANRRNTGACLSPKRQERLGQVALPTPCLAPAGFQTQVTWEVPAASSCAPPAPAALIERGIPVPEGPALQGIRREVADLQSVELT